MTNRDTPRPVIFGEVLFDRFPDGQERLGGAPFNVAWHLRGFGLDPLFVSSVGDDDRGQRIKAEMTRWGLDLAGLQTDPEHATGIVEVYARGEDVAYDIVGGRAYDFVRWSPALDRVSASVLYHGTLARREAVSRATLERLLLASPDSVFVDVNLRAPWWDATDVMTTLQRAQTVKLNDEELDALVPGPEAPAARAQRAVEDLGLEQLCVTQGKRGATLFAPGQPPLTVAPATGTDAVDPVGAGDAFSSVLLLGGVFGWDLATRLARAQAFAGAVVGIHGALPLRTDLYHSLKSAWSPA